MPAAPVRLPPVPALGLGWACLALLLGLGTVQALPALPPVGPAAGVAGGLALGAWAGWRRGARAAGVGVLLAAAAFAAGLAWASARAAWRLEAALDPAWEGRPLVLEAVVDELPQALAAAGGEGTLWRLRVQPLAAATDADGHRVRLPARVSLWYPLADPAPRAGERWRFHASLRRVHGLQNPGLPDSELWLLERGILAQGTVRAAERLAPAPATSLQALRQGLRDRIQATVDESRPRAVLAGLLLGDQAALGSDDWALLRDTGVVHLFSISGLHITGFAWLASALIAATWPAAWCLRCPMPLAARWGGVGLAWAYALLAGWGVPAQRTVALLLLVALLQTSGRLWPWPLALLVCAVPIALADPWALVQPGFWLSFVAVALLMQQQRARQPGARGALRELLHTQAVCTLGLAPLAVLFFGQLSLVGVLANLVAVPLVTLVLTPLALLGAVLPAAWSVAALGVDALFAFLSPLARGPGAVWSLPRAPAPWQALALGGLLLAALRLPRALRGLGLLGVLPLFLWAPARPVEGDFRLRVFDVGQGSAVWVQTARHELLYDAGPRWGEQDAGARLLLPALRAAGVERLDLLLLSHGDADHAGGAGSLLQAMPVGARLAPPDPRLRGLRAQPCVAGQHWTWDGVQFRVLHPPAAFFGPANASSCVLQVVAADGSAALLPGDIGQAEERALVASGVPLASDLLLLAHHGSAGSNAIEFLRAVQPRVALAQSGYRNRHGHPALAVQTRLRELGIVTLSSAGCGAYDWWSGRPPTPDGCWRRQRPRYWHQQGLIETGEEPVALQGPPEPP